MSDSGDNRKEDIGSSEVPVEGLKDRPREFLLDEIGRIRLELNSFKRNEQVRSERFLAVYHDIKSPINSIISCINVVLEEIAGPVTEEQRNLLEKAKKGLYELASLAERLLDDGES